MTNRKIARALLATSAIATSLCVGLGAGPAFAQSRAGDNASAGGIETITVTAEKRSEILQDVPMTVDVLPSQELEARGLFGVADLTREVPGLNLSAHVANTGGGPGQGEIIMRGVSSGADTSSVSGLLLDEVPLTSNSGQGGVANFNRLTLEPDLADIDRVEILEGPQSTLYGANSLGGLIKIVTKQPDLENFGGQAEVEGLSADGGGDGYALRGSVNIPIATDSVALRVTGVDRKDPGYIDNVETGQSNVNSDTVQGLRALLRIQFNDKLQTTIGGYAQDIDQGGSNFIFLDRTTQKPLYGKYAYSSPLKLGDSIKARGVSDVTNFDMGFATLTNVASYNYYSFHNISDYSFFAPLLGLPNGYGAITTTNNSGSRYTEEVRLTSAPGQLEWLVGGFYTNERDYFPFYSHTTDPMGVPLPTSSPYYVNVYTVSEVSHYAEYSAFGDLTYHFDNELQATVGGRYSSTKQDAFGVSTGAFAGGAAPSFNEAATDATYLATVTYKPEENLTFYARAASAYQPGGGQPLPGAAITAGVSPTYRPDSLWTYEVGSKGTFWDRRGSFSINAYHMDWSDVQVVATVASYYQAAINGGNASINGAEATLNLTPVDGLKLSFTGVLNDAKWTSVSPEASALGSSVGQSLPLSQKTSFTSTADYTYPLSADVSLFGGLTVAYHSGEQTHYSASSDFHLPSYYQLDLRAGVYWSNYTLTFRVNNATNQYALTGEDTAVFAGDPTVGTIIKPRIYTLALAAKF